ncbi:hypothetical protein FisN_24Lh074 [Fistulifera solaris]|uniref:BTB domain-containing protein n=1 Tax=Fistulifera solaris TaxID=1519565 RepID=A0A1Z5K938_FISSO|nr:hypothetical protein FisN_24Lh074 [Fistulifera solaris]|eukprot:GAX22793.1 hypothetical protein FisN_24Lh074 [Fistulifera solaris]
MKQVDLPKWRDDPFESFSDWKIEIACDDDDDDDRHQWKVYPVHKTFLAHGSRRSEYFSRLFHSETRFKENAVNTSHIVLHLIAVEAFPVLLDYIYGSALSITSENATALHHLGEYFEINPLQQTALEFCQQNMSLENLHLYYVAAQQLCNEPVMSLVTEFLRAHVDNVLPTHLIVEQSHPQLWIEALGLDPSQGNKRCNIYDTSDLSLVIAKMCRNQNEDTLDAKTFHTLAEFLTMIHPNAALDLCELADRYRFDDANHHGALPGLDLFQERCASTLSNQWQDLQSMDDLQVEKMLQRSPEFLVSLLMQSSKRATREVDRLSTELVQSEKLLIAAQKIQWR